MVRLKAIYVSRAIFRVTVVLKAGCVLNPSVLCGPTPPRGRLPALVSRLSTLAQICITHSHVSFLTGGFLFPAGFSASYCVRKGFRGNTARERRREDGEKEREEGKS